MAIVNTALVFSHTAGPVLNSGPKTLDTTVKENSSFFHPSFLLKCVGWMEGNGLEDWLE